MFEIVEQTKSFEMQLDAVEFFEELSEFTFSESVCDAPITYYVAGYVTRGLMKYLKCHECKLVVSDNNCPLNMNIEQLTYSANQEESEAKDVFLNAINRGGLTKPSDLLFVTCTHASDLFTGIRNVNSLYQRLINSTNSRSLFVEVFLGKLQDIDYTNSILMVKCSRGHPFSHIARKVASVMFNLFAKNIVTEANSNIHKKRTNDTVNSIKRNPSAMKKKKLTSS